MSEAVTKELPENWEWSTLGDVCEKPQYGWTTKASQEGDLHLLRTTDITSGQINWDTVPYCVEEPEDKEKYLIKDGDIVVSRAGSVGVSYLISNPEPSVFASYLIRFKPLIDRKYVYYFLKSPAYWNAISEKSAGIALQNVNASKLREIDIPVAPPEQQKRIVAKIEELFSHIDAGIEALKKAKQLLKQYRQSVLKAAVTGELTKEWREENKDKMEPASQLLERILKERREKWEEQQLEKIKAKGKMPKDDKWKSKYKEPESGGDRFFSEIPDEWTIASIDQLAWDVRYGSSSKTNDNEKGVPVLRMGNIVDGQLNYTNLKYLPKNHDEFPDLLLEDGDLLFNRTNSAELVGKTAVFREIDRHASLASYLIRVRVVSGVEPDFAAYFINSSYGKNWIKSCVSQNVGQANVNGTKLKALVIPLPSSEEQNNIVRVVEEKMDSSDRLLAELDYQLLKAEKSKQSILASVFSGNL